MCVRRLCLILWVVAACGPRDVPASHGRASGVATDSTAAIAMSGDWPSELGTSLVIPADTESTAVLLYPASISVVADPSAQFTLLAPDGDPVRVRVGVTASDSAHCGDAAILHLVRATPLLWSVGLAGTTARPLWSDSLDAFAAADSALYSVEAPRLASIVSARLSTRLSGLPFALSGVRRIQFGDTTIIAAQLTRRVNQEANPVEERTFVVAERAGSAPFTTVHSNRSEGSEDTAAHFDLLGAFRTTSALYLIVTTDTPSGSTIEILERSAGNWRVRWTRTISC